MVVFLNKIISKLRHILFFRRKCIVFIHIPKTAGTSFRLSMIEKLGESRICFDYQTRGQGRLLSKIVSDHSSDDVVSPEFRQAFNQSSYIALSGHFPAKRYVKAFGFHHFVAFVRDPVARAVSLYLHKQRNDSLDISFSEFIEKSWVRDAQYNQLLGTPWPAYALVGITERYSESLALINREFRSNFSVLTKNVAPSSSEACVNALDQTDLMVLERYNRKDCALYNEVSRYMDTRLECLSRRVPFVKGCYHASGEGYINGWLLSEDRDTENIIFSFFFQTQSDLYYINNDRTKQSSPGITVHFFVGKFYEGVDVDTATIYLSKNMQKLIRVGDADVANFEF